MGVGGEVTGTIYSIGETQQVTATFTKRVFVLTWADGKDAKGVDRFQFIEFQVMGRKCSDLDRWHEGEIVTVTYDLRGRLKNNGNGCFNELAAWKIEPAGDTSSDRRQTREREQAPREQRQQTARERYGDGAPPPAYDAPPIDDRDIPF